MSSGEQKWKESIPYKKRIYRTRDIFRVKLIEYIMYNLWCNLANCMYIYNEKQLLDSALPYSEPQTTIPNTTFLDLKLECWRFAIWLVKKTILSWT